MLFISMIAYPSIFLNPLYQEKCGGLSTLQVCSALKCMGSMNSKTNRYQLLHLTAVGGTAHASD